MMRVSVPYVFRFLYYIYIEALFKFSLNRVVVFELPLVL